MLIFGAGLVTGSIAGVVLMCLCFISGAEERRTDKTAENAPHSSGGEDNDKGQNRKNDRRKKDRAV